MIKLSTTHHWLSKNVDVILFPFERSEEGPLLIGAIKKMDLCQDNSLNRDVLITIMNMCTIASSLNLTPLLNCEHFELMRNIHDIIIMDDTVKLKRKNQQLGEELDAKDQELDAKDQLLDAKVQELDTKDQELDALRSQLRRR